MWYCVYIYILWGQRTCLFLGELKRYASLGNQHRKRLFKAEICKKVFIVAEPEFGELVGHLLLIEQALYGLQFSGRMFKERLTECLRELGFKLSKSERNIFIRPSKEGDCYKYVATYVDNSHASSCGTQRRFCYNQNRITLSQKGLEKSSSTKGALSWEIPQEYHAWHHPGTLRK